MRTAWIGLVLAILAGCGGGSPTSPQGEGQGLNGSWQEVYAAPEDRHFTYFEAFYIEANKISYLYGTEDGLRGISEYDLLVAGNEIDLDGDLWTFQRNGDTITAEYDGTEVTLQRNPTGPTPDNWFRKVDVQNEVPLVSEATGGLVWDGQQLLAGGARETDAIYKLDPLTGEELGQIPFEGDAYALTMYQGQLWSSDGGVPVVYQIDATTGERLFTSAPVGPWVAGMASDNGRIWCLASNDRALVEYSPNVDIVGRTVNYRQVSAGGLTYADGYLYLSSWGVVHKINVNNFEIVDIFGIEGRALGGLATDGTTLWAQSRPLDGDGERSLIAIELQ